MTRPMTPLRRRMIDDMAIRNMSPATQKAYVYAIKNFSAFFRRSPDELSFEQVREYQLHLVSRGLKAATINVVVCALRFLYGTTLGRPEVADQVPLARSTGAADPSFNYFGVRASQPLSVWREKGWIHPDDPRGWFQWYCRYYMGRRMSDEDTRQIKRWKAMRRHVRQLQLACEPGDVWCRKRQRQALLHWAYDSRKL